MKKIVLLLTLGLLSYSTFAQQYRLTGTEISNFKNEALQKSFEAYSVFRTDAAPFFHLATTNPNTLDLQLDFEGLPKVSAPIAPSPLIAEGYFTTTATTKGNIVDYNRPQVFPFLNANGSSDQMHVALTVAADFLYGFFESDGQEFFLEPVWYFDKSQPHDLYVIYNKGDVKTTEEMHCGVTELAHEKDKVRDRGGDVPQKCGPPELRIALASDFSMVQKYGSSSAVLTHNIAVMNNVQGNFDHDFNKPILFKIVTQWVSSSTAMDPAVSTTTNPFLYEFRDWSINGGFGTSGYDLAHLRTAHLFGTTVGASFQDVICNDAFEYGFLSEYTTIACRLKKHTSHEIGHSFGANHPPTYTGSIMDQGGFCSDVWAPFSLAEINDGIYYADCLFPSGDCPLPTSVAVPEVLASICTGVEACYNFNENPCIATFNILTNDPNLQVTVTGRTICLKSLAKLKRNAILVVTPLDFCGRSSLPATSVPSLWNIKIDDPAKCPGFTGDGEDRESAEPTGVNDLTIQLGNNYINIEDPAVLPREKNIQVFDLLGKQLMTQQESGNFFQVPLNNLPAGILVIKIATGQQVITKKVMHF